jgi:hypothetical protein
MNNLNRLQKLLKSIDNNKTYFNIHAGDILGSFFLIIIIIIAFIYLAVKRNNVQLRKEWQKNKCRPEVSVLAGWINAPPGSSFDDKLKYTEQNFTACNVGILESNMKNFTSPFENAQGVIRSLFDMVKKIIIKIKRLAEILQLKLLQVISEIFGKIFQIMIELQKILFKLKDTFMKATGALQAGFLLIVGQAYTFMTFMNSIIHVCVTLLVILAIIQIVLFALGYALWFTGPISLGLIAAAVSTLLTYLGMAIPLIIVIVFVAAINNELKRREDMICFHPETKIKLANGGYKQMKDLNLGEKLTNNIEVIAVLRIKGGEKDKYYKIYSKELNDYIYVTGTHLIMHPKTKKFIPVEKYENARITNSWTNEMSCLVTSNHNIHIGEFTFYDWED